MRNRFARFMYGRYGVDALNNFLFGLYVALFVLELFFRRTVAGQVMVILGYPIILLYFFRCFSRNIYKRSAENQRFLKLWNPVKNYGHYIKMKFVERGGTKKLCHQIIRVPKGKGKIAITCPKCRFEFIKRT